MVRQDDPPQRIDNVLASSVAPPRRPLLRRLLLTSSSAHDHDFSDQDSTSNDDCEDEFGLLIRLGPNTSNNGSQEKQQEKFLQLALVADHNFHEIHPHVFAPALMRGSTQVLYGGGSGVAVFGGKLETGEEVVMKHGGYKDLNELFALATIQAELTRRSTAPDEDCHTTTQEQRTDAAEEMRACMPQFRFIYISPNHIVLRDNRGQELWQELRRIIHSWSFDGLPQLTMLEQENTNNENTATEECITLQNQQEEDPTVTPQTTDDLAWNDGMSIRLYEGSGDRIRFFIDTTATFSCSTQHNSNPQRKPSLGLVLPLHSSSQSARTGNHSSIRQSQNIIELQGDAFARLENVIDELRPIMMDHLYKFTLGQKRIGSHTSQTGNQWLYEGVLEGDVLSHLVSQFVAVIRRLQVLTGAKEADVVAEIRQELDALSLLPANCLLYTSPSPRD